MQRGGPEVVCLEGRVTGPCWASEHELRLSRRAAFEFQAPPGQAMPLVLFLPPDDRTASPVLEAGVFILPLGDLACLSCHCAHKENIRNRVFPARYAL